MYKGTWKSSNQKTVTTTSPDCLVYINGELSLPSGASPYKRVPIQPLINSVSVNLGVENTPGSASLDLHIPRHYIDDFYRGGELILSTMMEVQIYMKGHFTVGGSPRYYPAFWGVVTSLDEGYSGGEHSVSMSCSDILYWWQQQQINMNPGYMAARQSEVTDFNLKGNHFTQMNPFNIMYTLSRQVYGDSMNASSFTIPNKQTRSETNPDERLNMMAYWTLKWGRISNSLKMYGPKGQVLQGSRLAQTLKGNNREQFLQGKPDLAEKYENKKYEPYKLGDIDVESVSPFSFILSQTGAPDLWNSEFETKLSLAQQTKEAIGYEFFMDTTGELIFKPPFYNLDVKPNKPVSWIRDRDVIDWNFSENPPEATFIEATGNMVKNKDLGMSDLTKNKAVYADYRLVQKYGWKPHSFSSEFIGSDSTGGPKALFYHLVDVLDRENAGVNSGTITIPIRPEMRLGYPVYVEGKDCYYYVKGISHTFSYASRCTTQLTVEAKRKKHYADFDSWEKNGKEPSPGDIADPNQRAQNTYSRPIDEDSGTPVGDRNVIMTYLPEKDLEETYGENNTFNDKDTDSEKISRSLVSLRSQFGVNAPNKFVYMSDPNRDNEEDAVTHIEADPKVDVDREGRSIEINSVILPVSDERGYEVIGTYEYGRRVSIDDRGFNFQQNEDEKAVRGLRTIKPQSARNEDDKFSEDKSPNKAYSVDVTKDSNFQVNPNNYGRLLTEVEPSGVAAASGDIKRAANIVTDELTKKKPSTSSEEENKETDKRQGGLQRVTSEGAKEIARQNNTKIISHTSTAKAGRTFSYNSNVAKWRQDTRAIRNELGLSEENYPDHLVMSFVHTESVGDPTARRTNDNGKKSQFVGLLQIGKSNAKDIDYEDGRKTNTDFMGDGQSSIEHFYRVQEKYKKYHQYDEKKMTILWATGIGTLKGYNELERNGATPQELEKYLQDNYHSDEYISRYNSAKSVWTKANQEWDDDPPEKRDVVADSLKGTDITEIDGATQLKAAQIIDSVGKPGDNLEEQVKAFKNALPSTKGGNKQLPSVVKAPRDENIVAIINEWLEDLYESAFRKGRTKEKELRGTTKNIPVAPSGQDVVTDTNQQDKKPFVDAPFDRPEIRQSLEEGETLQDILSEDGTLGQLEKQAENFNNEGD